MASFEVSGKVIAIMSEQQVSEKFRKRTFAVEVADGAYPQYLLFQFSQDKCSVLDQCKVGEEVKVNFNLQGKAFQKNGDTMYFNTLAAWKLEKVGGSTGNNQPPSGGAATQTNFTVDNTDNDLPF